MTRRSVRPTFAEVVAQAVTSETPPNARWAGRFDPQGRWFDPAGAELALKEKRITTRRAAQAVRHGALIAHESCGCGGYVGCQPDWFTDDLPRRAVAAAPEYIHGEEPSWIDLWRSRHGDVVLMHGAVTWPGLF